MDMSLYVIRQFDPLVTDFHLTKLLELVAAKQLYHAYLALLRLVMRSDYVNYDNTVRLLSQLKYFQDIPNQHDRLLYVIFTERKCLGKNFKVLSKSSIIEVLQMFVA